MSIALPFQAAPETPEGGIVINRIKLLGAMADEICRQVPGIGVEARLYNALIKASNDIADEFARPVVKATEGMGLEKWLNSDDTGSSSLYLAWILSGGQFGIWQGRSQPEPAYPHDPDDFGRCRRLILAVPAFAEKIDMMLEHGDQWIAVANNWQDWVNMYDADDPDLYQLYQAMKAAYGEE